MYDPFFSFVIDFVKASYSAPKMYVRQSPEAFFSRYSPSYYYYYLYLLFTSLKLGCFYCWLVHSFISKTVANKCHVLSLCKHDLQTRRAHRLQDVSCLVYSLCLSLFRETNVSCHDGTWCCHCWSLILSDSCIDGNIHLLELGLWRCLRLEF